MFEDREDLKEFGAFVVLCCVGVLCAILAMLCF